MKIILLFFTLFISTLLSSTNIAYDRNSATQEQMLSKIVFDIQEVSLKPVLNQSTALYEIKNVEDVQLATTLSVTVNAIHNNNPKKVANYTLISALEKQNIHIVVRKGSKFRTIYDLNNRNINVGTERDAMDLFVMDLSSNFKIILNQHYNNTQNAIINMVQGGGIDAVVFSDKVPSAYLEKYKEHIRLINIPSMKGFKQTLISKKSYSQDKDTISVESDLLLIATNTYVNNNQITVNKIIDNIFDSAYVNKSNICNQRYVLQTSPYQSSNCTNYIASKITASKSGKKIQRKASLSLVKAITSLDDIEIYPHALLKNKSFGGLNKKSELKKLDKIVEYYKEESAGGSAKLIIKSYSNNSNAYKNAQKIFKFLKKRGIKRGNMIIKSYKTTEECNKKIDIDCKYLNAKVTFEFI